MGISLKSLRKYISATCVLFAVMMSGNYAQAEFGISWYDYYFDATSATSVPSHEATSANTLVAYTGYNTMIDDSPAYATKFQAYLDLLAVNNMKVIIDISTLTGRYADSETVANNITENLTAFLDMFDSHAAVAGYNIGDEPVYNNIPYSSCEAIYNLIKSKSEKTVSMNFSGRPEFWGAPTTMDGTYDTAMSFAYPCWGGKAEFQAFDNASATWWGDASWKECVDHNIAEAHGLGKEAVITIQAFGNFKDDGSTYYRLPTEAEERFMAYYAIVKGADGLTFWSYGRLLDSPAESDQVYTGDGTQWAEEVGKPLTEELNMMQDALSGGAVDGLVTESNADVNSKVYKDGNIYYLIAVNENSGDESVTFNLSFEDEITSIELLGEGAVTPDGSSFSRVFTDYDTAVYKITTVPEPATAIAAIFGLAFIARKSKRGKMA